MIKKKSSSYSPNMIKVRKICGNLKSPPPKTDKNQIFFEWKTTPDGVEKKQVSNPVCSQQRLIWEDIENPPPETQILSNPPIKKGTLEEIEQDDQESSFS